MKEKERSTAIVPFAARFGEEPPSQVFFRDENGVQLVEMSNPTHVGDCGDEAS